MDINIDFSSDSEIRRAGASLSQELVSLRVDTGTDNEQLQQLSAHVIHDAISAGGPEYVIPLLAHAVVHSSMLVSGALRLVDREETSEMSREEAWEVVRKTIWNLSFPSDD